MQLGDVSDNSFEAVCVGVTEERFRPDGDGSSALGLKDSIAVEAEVSSGSTPELWRGSVFDSQGTLIYRSNFASSSSSHTFVWDGRDQGEKIQDPGLYQIHVDAPDRAGNVKSGCVRNIILDNEEGVYRE